MRGLRPSALSFLVKERGQVLQDLGAPVAQLIGMNLMLGSELQQRLVLVEQLADELGFDSRGGLFLDGGL